MKVLFKKKNLFEKKQHRLNKSNKLNQKGFTLIELLVVSTIIVILSAIGLVSFTNAGKSARDSKRKADLETVRQALVLYRSDLGTYPIVLENSIKEVELAKNLFQVLQVSKVFAAIPEAGGSAAKYDSMINLLSGANYISDPTPQDPKDSGEYLYKYDSDGSTFTLSATLERDPFTMTLTSP